MSSLYNTEHIEISNNDDIISIMIKTDTFDNTITEPIKNISLIIYLIIMIQTKITNLVVFLILTYYQHIIFTVMPGNLKITLCKMQKN